jgi:ATP-dependent DNA helicase RecG
VDPELMRRVDALRRPLELAAADGFSGVRKVAGLGHALRTACDGVIARMAPARSNPTIDAAEDALAQWRATLATWEQLDETQQAVEVAKGMRLLARFPRAARQPVSRTNAPGLARSAVPVARLASPRPMPVPTPSAVPMPPVAPAPVIAAAVAEPKAKRSRAASAPPAEPVDPLAAPTRSLPGIGPAFAERLAEKGLVTVEDLLWMVPRRYDDVRDAKSLDDVIAMPEGERATFVANVTSARMIFARGRRWAEVRLVSLAPPQTTAFGVAPPASALVRWFNVFAGIEQRMPAGARVALSGVVRKRGGRLELANPDILGIEIEGVAGKPMPSIIARYPDVAGVPAGRLRAACAAACARVADCADDGVPASIERAAALPSLAATLAQLHSPSPDIAPEDLAAMNRGDSGWQRRLAFGELFALGVAITLRRRERRHDAAMPCVKTARLDEDLVRALPFTLTGAQRRSIDELATDLAQSVPMNRLLQGDVGAGKTAVAFAAALQVARAGRQTAVMAPTELLAEQHMETWRAWAKATKLRIDVLTASTPKGLRQSLLALLAAGQLDVLIGTHALLAESVGFGSLGLVVIDEQHRFGVAQRARLRDKGDGNGAPHLLVMTATPIPRTLALTAYGDLDVSVLDELPPGRQPVATKTLSGARGRASAYKLVAERVAAGERAYVVCPKVEPTEGDDDDDRVWKDATTTATEIAAELPGVRVGLVHGRLDSSERDRVMRAFKLGEIQVLVATTVIEVGVDVPAATVMVIHDAERFGLAQLHQLRGRVGRGGGAAHCVMLAQGVLGPDAEHRLGAMVETHDGFRIAEYDLSLRGPGELLGPKQAGVPRLRFGDLSQHTALLLEARRFAEQLLDEDPALVRPEHAALRRAIDRRFAQSAYGAESG